MGKSQKNDDVVIPVNILVLFILYHFGRSYGLEIIKRAELLTKQRVSLGGIYALLDRLIEKKFVSFEWDPGRGPGARRKYFELTELGKARCQKFRDIINGHAL